MAATSPDPLLANVCQLKIKRQLGGLGEMGFDPGVFGRFDLVAALVQPQLSAEPPAP